MININKLIDKVSLSAYCVGVLLSGFLLGVSTPVIAATLAMSESGSTVAKLTQIRGRVMVNFGSTYSPASPGMVVQTGTKIITANGGAVTLVFKDGCSKQLTENTMLTIGKVSDCADGLVKPRDSGAHGIGEPAPEGPIVPAQASTINIPVMAAWSAAVIGTIVNSTNSKTPPNPNISAE